MRWRTYGVEGIRRDEEGTCGRRSEEEVDAPNLTLPEKL